MEEKEIEMIKKFYKKIATVRDSMDRIPKNGYNNFHKYFYATEDDVTTFLRKQLSDNNLVTSVSCKNSEIILNEGGKKESTLTRVELEFKIIDLETGYYECFSFDGVGEDKGDKGIYKAYTGAVKYFLMKFFLVSTGDDVEKEDISYNNKTKEKQPEKKDSKTRPKGDFIKFMQLLKSPDITLELLEQYKSKKDLRIWTPEEEKEIEEQFLKLNKELNPFDDSNIPM